MTLAAEEMELPRILAVDDEPHVTAGICRTFFDEFDIDTAEGGDEALQMVASEGPYAVILSDMRMPGMNGATLLARARTMEPDMTRVLLTGQSELDAAISAINEGHVFRFLSKPCPEATLRATLNDAIRQHQLVKAERELLERTLQGTVQVLTEVLSMAAPAAFARTNQVSLCVSHLADALGLQDTWQLKLAAMLSQLGLIALPPDVLADFLQGKELSPEDQELVQGHREVAFKLLQRIPRLEGVAAIVRGAGSMADVSRLGPTVSRDIELVNLSVNLEQAIGRGRKPEDALRDLKHTGEYAEEHLQAVHSFLKALASPQWVTRELEVRQLAPGMKTLEDVVSPSGGLLVPKGRELSAPLIERLRNFAHRKAVVEPVTVAVPSV